MDRIECRFCYMEIEIKDLGRHFRETCKIKEICEICRRKIEPYELMIEIFQTLRYYSHRCITCWRNTP